MAPAVPSSRARREASAWFARLRTRNLATETLANFEAWRADPENAAAFRELESVWKAGNGLEASAPMQAAIAEALAPPVRRQPARSLRWVAPAAAGLALTGALAAAAFVYVDPPLGGAEYRTGVGEARTIALADGSTVQLNTDSELVVRLGARNRDLWLSRGQAYFTVAHDPSRPFIVRADGARVRATGTQFDVRRSGRGVDVTLVEGAVAVSHRLLIGSQVQALRAGESLHADAEGLQTAHLVDLASQTAWRSGHMVFHDAPLSAVLDEMNRYTPHRIALAEESDLAKLRVNGIFDTGDAPALLLALKDLYRLDATPRADGSILLQPAPP